MSIIDFKISDEEYNRIKNKAIAAGYQFTKDPDSPTGFFQCVGVQYTNWVPFRDFLISKGVSFEVREYSSGNSKPGWTPRIPTADDPLDNDVPFHIVKKILEK